MPDQQRGTDRAGRRAKHFLSPSQKYEVFLQVVRQEMTMAEAADHWQVDRGTVMRIRTVAKEGAPGALASSRPGVKAKERDFELEAAPGGRSKRIDYRCHAGTSVGSTPAATQGLGGAQTAARMAHRVLSLC